ncbi:MULTISPECIES: hypothetical protein [Kamptonema]|uniref:hypothetical protein n=1 Tax=Kamptonema TaxID=1501433 RepID=UPI0001DAD3E1|nr:MULTISPECIES: hypothetical protein [Kamptonema]CBN58843.1 hypothetical protein OSCI_3900017 [Kamptonema sp. PCC 6506]
MNDQINKPLEIWLNEDLLLPEVREVPLLMHLSPPETNPELQFWNLLRDKLPELVKIHRFTNLADAGKIVVIPHFIANYYRLKKEDKLDKFRRKVSASKRTLVTFSNCSEYKPYQGEIFFASSTYRDKKEKLIPTPQWIFDLGEKANIPKPSIPTVSFVGNIEYPSRLNSLILRYVKFSDSMVNSMAGSIFVNRNLKLTQRMLIAQLVRKKIINEVRKAKNLQTFVIERKGEFYSLPLEEKKRQRAEYIESIENNAYILTMRGDDNGCYRLWEVMSAGRIPVLIDTNRLLPELSGMKWEDFCVIVPFSEVHRIGEYIQAFHDRLSEEEFAEVCRKSRAAFEQLLPHNFIFRILEIIANSTN